MKAELINKLNAEQAQRLYRAYAAIVMTYEEVCGGYYAAREHREYFGASDSMMACRRRYNDLIVNSDGESGTSATTGGANQ